MSKSVRPHRQQSTRLPRPWDSPGNNSEVGCHFLLQCMKVNSESEVAQSYPTLSDPMDCSLPGSSVHGIFQARVLEWGAIAFFEFCHEISAIQSSSGSSSSSLDISTSAVLSSMKVLYTSTSFIRVRVSVFLALLIYLFSLSPLRM